MTKAEWSGWVQAIGSIAAILAGFLFVQRAHYLTRLSEYRERLATNLEEVSLLIQMLSAHADQAERCVAAWREGREVDRPDVTRASYLSSLVRDAKTPALLPSELQVEWLLAHAASGSVFTLVEDLYGNLRGGVVLTAANYLPPIVERLVVMRATAAQLAAYSEHRLFAAQAADAKRNWFSP